jgi:DNA-cytosine methyltransferase|tara:strand:+ start:8150 stop:10078 length:1929 start_codon:yes stop_codon:yes gene_type:complete
MKVLSLFDGMSCTQIALKNLGIKVDTYYASEIDKYGIQVTQANFPDTVQVGDITKLNPNDYKDVTLIVAGSPCQGFSFSGKQLAFDDPRSALFFEFVRLLKAIKPKYFLLENVRMKKEFQEVITQQVSECYPEYSDGQDLFGGRIEPILINSSLLSAQSRQRLYWTNIPNIEQPDDLGIVLRDILETDGETDLVGNNGCVALKENIKKGSTLLARDYKGWNTYGMTGVRNKPKQVGKLVERVKIRQHPVDIDGLQKLLSTHKKKSKYTNQQIAEKLNIKKTLVDHWFRSDEHFTIPGDDVWLKLKKLLSIEDDSFDIPLLEFEIRDGVFESTQRVYSDEGKSPTLTSTNPDKLIQTPLQVGSLDDIKGHDILKRVYSEDGKSPTVTAHAGKGTVPKVETKPKKAFDIPREILKDNEMRRRVYSSEGKSPTVISSYSPKIQTKSSDKPIKLANEKGNHYGGGLYDKSGKSPTLNGIGNGGGGTNNIPKVLKTKPEQVGVASDVNGHDILKRVYSPDGKAPTLNSMGGGNREPKVISGGALRGRAYDSDGKRMDRDGSSVANQTKQMLELRKDDKSNAITTVSKDSVAVKEDLTWRKLTVRECRRLQTIPEDYQMPVSNTQAYKMLGNGFTVSVIEHILKNMDI